MQLYPKEKTFSEYFEIYIKSGTFYKKNMTLLADVFSKLRTPKKVVR